MTYEQYLKNEKMNLCQDFFNQLGNKLAGTYETVGSCNRDLSAYLIPNGTARQITYYGKPDCSFRVSDHWNWYSNLKKCNKPNYIQCMTRDLPFTNKRKAPGKASDPICGICVCLFRYGIYEVVYGEKYNRQTKTWSWVDNTPEAVAAMI